MHFSGISGIIFTEEDGDRWRRVRRAFYTSQLAYLSEDQAADKPRTIT